ncbi:MAG: hypothetical protein ACYSW3_27820 [Planctomycetota bacterium]|jgi:hypothetical protein
MAKRYYIAVGIVLGLTLLTELYFGDLSFDGPNHSAVILLSGLVYATVSVGIVATVQKVWKRCSQQAASDEPC